VRGAGAHHDRPLLCLKSICCASTAVGRAASSAPQRRPGRWPS